MESAVGFDAVEVVARAVALDVTSASIDELRWDDRGGQASGSRTLGAGRVRGRP